MPIFKREFNHLAERVVEKPTVSTLNTPKCAVGVMKTLCFVSLADQW